MPQSYLSQYFSGVALKTLTAVEANTAASNQHEYNGNRDLVRLFGKATSKHRFPARFVYVSADEKEKITDEAPVTWYDARQNHPSRSEHRLYFPTTRVSRRAAAGDLLVIGMLRDNSVLVVIAKEDSPIATDLRRLFRVPVSEDERFSLWRKEGGPEEEEEARSLLQTIGVLDRADTAISSTSGRPAGTAVVVTSLPSDYAAVIGQLRDISEQADELGTLFEVGRYDSPVGIWEIAIVQLALGTLYAVNAVEQAVQRFLPEVVVLLGAAHSVREGIAVGDVIVASAITGGDADQNESLRPETPASSHRVLQRAFKEASGEAWLARKHLTSTGSEPPRVIVAPIATSTRLTVVSDGLDASRAVAVDMEDAGVLGALAHRNGIELLVIRGVASVGQFPKIGDTRVASDNATAFAFQVLSAFQIDSVPEPSFVTPLPVHKDPQSYIGRFTICSIRSIHEITWQVPATVRAGWHVLVGINASGKTTALRCIALALLGNRDAQPLGQRWDTWVPDGAASGDTTVTLAGIGAEHVVKVSFRAASEAPEQVDLVISPQAPTAVFSVGYGPFRRFSGGDEVLDEGLTPGARRHITLFSERADLAASLGWLKRLYVKSIDGGGSFDWDVQDFINKSKLLPSGMRLDQVSADKITFKDGNECAISIEDLSDGFRSVLSLVLDILRNLSEHEPNLDPFSEDRTYVVASGIVLIDEIDVHLHPKWQQDIGVWFKKHFPNFQFIVATHSLFVCQSADSVFILPDPGAVGSGRMLSEVELDQIRYGTVLDGYGTNVFGRGVDESEGSRKRAEQLATLNLKQLREGLTVDEKADQTRLRAMLPTGDVLRDPAVPE
jgi:nucleoside phosphorylase